MESTGPEVAGQHVEVEAKAATVEALEEQIKQVLDVVSTVAAWVDDLDSHIDACEADVPDEVRNAVENLRNVVAGDVENEVRFRLLSLETEPGELEETPRRPSRRIRIFSSAE